MFHQLIIGNGTLVNLISLLQIFIPNHKEVASSHSLRNLPRTDVPQCNTIRLQTMSFITEISSIPTTTLIDVVRCHKCNPTSGCISYYEWTQTTTCLNLRVVLLLLHLRRKVMVLAELQEVQFEYWIM